MSEEEIIEKINWAIHVNEMTKSINGDNTHISVNVLQGLLDLYNKEKEFAMGLYYDVQGLQQDLDKEKEKNIQDMIKDVECSNFIKNNYIHKNKIEELLQDVDNTKFINKHVKGMYLYNNLKCLLEK